MTKKLKRDLGAERSIARTVNKAKSGAMKTARQKINKKISNKPASNEYQQPSKEIQNSVTDLMQRKKTEREAALKAFPVVRKLDPGHYDNKTKEQTVALLNKHMGSLNDAGHATVPEEHKKRHRGNIAALASNAAHAIRRLEESIDKKLKLTESSILGALTKRFLPKKIEPTVKPTITTPVEKKPKKPPVSKNKLNSDQRKHELALALKLNINNHGGHPDGANEIMAGAHRYLTTHIVLKGVLQPQKRIPPQPQTSGAELKKKRDAMFQKNDHQKTGQLTECVNIIKRLALEMSLGGISGTGAPTGGISGGGNPISSSAVSSKFRRKNRSRFGRTTDARQRNVNVLKRLPGVKAR